MPGPVPKRSSERRRRNKDAVQTEKVELADGHVEPPPAVDGWHPIAEAWFESLKDSGQARFYEPSDWALALLIGESMSRDLKPQPIGVHEETGKPVFAAVPLKGASLAAYLKAMTNLLVTEGDRRRVRMEIERGKTVEEPAGVTALDEYRTALEG